MAWQADDAHIKGEVFSAKLGTDADLACRDKKFLLELEVPECLAVFVALGGQGIVVAGGGHLDGFQTAFSRGAANDEGDVVGRAGGGSQGAHFLDTEFFQAFRIEQGFCFLIEKCFIGRAAAFGDEEKFVFVAGFGINIDLGGEIALGIDLLIHAQWSGL